MNIMILGISLSSKYGRAVLWTYLKSERGLLTVSQCTAFFSLPLSLAHLLSCACNILNTLKFKAVIRKLLTSPSKENGGISIKSQ